MGCVKSKRAVGSGGARNSAEGGRGEKAYLVAPPPSGAGGGAGQMNPALVAYAQRLSEEIVARAVQQWAELDSRYSDIPYIECDVP